MFKKPTVFILGAGASWHYGYPTGEDLVPMVISKADDLAAFFKGGFDEWSGNYPDYVLRLTDGATNNHWKEAQVEALELSIRLKRVNPTLIDYFLKQNPKLHDIGRLAIALVIFDCEKEFYEQGGNPNHIHRHLKMQRQGHSSKRPDVTAFNDDWVRFVIHQITKGCASIEELNENNDLTFNYDVSLEKRLYDALSAIGIYDPERVGEFLKGRVLRVYGGVRETVDQTWLTHSIELPASPATRLFLQAVDGLNLAFKASRGIRTIDGPDKETNQDVLMTAQTAISRAETVYILGYGFDESNNTRIGLQRLRPQNSKSLRKIYFTNFGDATKVSRAAGRLLAEDEGSFLEKKLVRPTASVANGFITTVCEMSTKDVYGALCSDFELESE